MRSRSIGGIARKRKEATPTSEVNSGNAEAPLAAAARRPPLPVTPSASADTKAKKGRKEVTFGSESRDKGQRRERSLNEPPPPPALERKSARERRRAEREDAKKAAEATTTTTTTTTSKVKDECGGGAPAGGENVPGANSGKNYMISRVYFVTFLRRNSSSQKE